MIGWKQYRLNRAEEIDKEEFGQEEKRPSVCIDNMRGGIK
jgi:hypothetical protein